MLRFSCAPPENATLGHALRWPTGCHGNRESLFRFSWKKRARSRLRPYRERINKLQQHRPEEKVTESHRWNPLVDNKRDLSKIALAKGECAKSLAPLHGIPAGRFLNLEVKVMPTRSGNSISFRHLIRS